MKTLALAYACEPAEGSEPGAGWAWARMLAELGEVHVITRKNNREPIETFLSESGQRPNITFHYVDLPKWARFWKKGDRGLRPYYVLWQIAVFLKGRRLHKSEGFDLVWHLTLANSWLGSLGGRIGPPFVFGPVGGGVGTRWRLFKALGKKGAVYEVARAATRGFNRYLNPLARSAWRRADLILVQNSDTVSWFPVQYRARCEVFPHVVLEEDAPVVTERDEWPNTAIFAGRLLAWKGVSLALMALARTPDWRFIVCGSGGDESRLKELAVELGVQNRVEFKGWQPREEVLRLMREEAGVFLFPSLHDEAGWVVIEAQAAGLPVICLDAGGPAELAGAAGRAVSSRGTPDAVAERLAGALRDEARPEIDELRSIVQEYEFKRRTELLDDLAQSVLSSKGVKG